MAYTKDNKIRITVPCLACENPHVFHINSATFFEKDLLELSCKVLGINICFIGNKDKVFAAVEKANKELEELMGEYSIDDIGRIGSSHEGSITDAQVSDLVRFMLCEMKDENSIQCKCKNNDGEYDFELKSNNVEIFCTKCGASKTLELNSVQKAADFIYIDNLVLE